MFQLQTLGNKLLISYLLYMAFGMLYYKTICMLWLQNNAPVHWNDIKASLDYQLIFYVYSMLVEISLDFFHFSR